jgi:hypothetical protein
MNADRNDIEKWKPGVPKSALLLIAGIVWILVGVMLVGIAYSWLKIESSGYAILACSVGFVCSLGIHHFGFLRIVDRNLDRILPMEGRRCIFSFMPWKSYLLILIMIAFGVLLRHSPIPKIYLSVLYVAIGTALILSSLRYLRYLILTLRGRRIK